MTATLDRPPASPPPQTGSPSAPRRADRTSWLSRPRYKRFTLIQLIVLALATVAPIIIVGSITARLVGLTSTESMMTVALAAGENPGMLTFGAMFLASPVQWFTGRSQVRVRKYLGIIFFLLALSNGGMFVLESGLTATLGAPLLIAGSFALALATPLFLTSSRRSQRAMGMKNWRRLHKLTYPLALGLLAHVILIGDVGPGAVMIGLGFIARIPAVRGWLTSRADV